GADSAGVLSSGEPHRSNGACRLNPNDCGSSTQNAYAAGVPSVRLWCRAATRSLYCQESFYRSRESIASPIVCPAPIRRDDPGWITRCLGEGRRSIGTRVSVIVGGGRYQEAREETLYCYARDLAT